MEQGSVLRRKESAQKTQEKLSLNPFGTGQCLTTKSLALMDQLAESLNPFGTGQCLTTRGYYGIRPIFMSQSLWNRAVSYDVKADEHFRPLSVSIPLEQGSVLRLIGTML